MVVTDALEAMETTETDATEAEVNAVSDWTVCAVSAEFTAVSPDCVAAPASELEVARVPIGEVAVTVLVMELVMV